MWHAACAHMVRDPVESLCLLGSLSCLFLLGVCSCLFRHLPGLFRSAALVRFERVQEICWRQNLMFRRALRLLVNSDLCPFYELLQERSLSTLDLSLAEALIKVVCLPRFLPGT